jgi:hypothetical protein
VLLGIVFLMTTNPPLLEAILGMVIAPTLGLVAGLVVWWTARSRGTPL